MLCGAGTASFPRGPSKTESEAPGPLQGVGRKKEGVQGGLQHFTKPRRNHAFAGTKATQHH